MLGMASRPQFWWSIWPARRWFGPAKVSWKGRLGARFRTASAGLNSWARDVEDPRLDIARQALGTPVRWTFAADFSRLFWRRRRQERREISSSQAVNRGRNGEPRWGKRAEFQRAWTLSGNGFPGAFAWCQTHFPEAYGGRSERGRASSGRRKMRPILVLLLPASASRRLRTMRLEAVRAEFRRTLTQLPGPSRPLFGRTNWPAGTGVRPRKRAGDDT
jgi:hypothetical protein